MNEADAFVVAATSNRRDHAEAILRDEPEIARDSWVRLVLGREWEGDPVQPGGPRGWAPLLYVCHSCFASAALARELLERGADPNAFFVSEYGSMSALYGAAGVVHDPALTRVLLEAGANPDDGESLYHSTEATSPECLRLLLEAGADPKEGAILAHAVRRGRDSETLRLLVAHGAELDRPGGETWRGDVPLRTPYQHAVLRGRTDLAETLAELGASTDVAPEDLAVAMIARGETPDSPLPGDLDPDAQEVMILAALWGDLDVVLNAVGPNFSGVVGGSPRGPLLAHAAWVGNAKVVRRLLEVGADSRARAESEFDTPLAWAAHGSFGHAAPGRDYVAVAEQLVAAGNAIEPRFLDVAEGPLYDWLKERLA